jgi:hypothetical protein
MISISDLKISLSFVSLLSIIKKNQLLISYQLSIRVSSFNPQILYVYIVHRASKTCIFICYSKPVAQPISALSLLSLDQSLR